jgi:hypothetical protein
MENGVKLLQQGRVRAWQLAGPALDAMRHEEIRNSDARGIQAVLLTAEMRQRLGIEVTVETGLIEQQAWFAKLRHG